MDENSDPQIFLQIREERDFGEILTDAVKGCPHLYDTVLDRVEICSNRWTRLRGSYSKEKKKRQIGNKSGSGAALQRGSIHFKDMRFIDGFVKTRCSVSNIKLTQPFGLTHHSQSEDQKEAILKWIQRSDFTSQTQSSSSQQSIMNVSGSTTSRPTPCTALKVMNFEDTLSTSSLSTDFNMNNDFENRLLSMSSKSPLLTNQSPQPSPTTHKIVQTFEKPPSHVKGRFNPYVKVKKYNKKKAENVEFETSFIHLSTAVIAYLKNERKPQETSNDEDNAFCNLIITELKEMNEDEKFEKKRQILKVLWQNSSPKKD